MSGKRQADRTLNGARIVVTGAGGMLGRAVVEACAEAGEVNGLRRSDCDLADLEATRRCIEALAPQHIVHCAAYTDVDGCELDPERARRDNDVATRNVASVAQLLGSTLCYISTDYVFDGCKSQPYREDDPVAPLNAYGRSKRAGEEHVLRVPQSFVVRTSWLFGPGGKNFVRTMSELMRKKDEIRVVDDQTGSPTYTCDLAASLAALVPSGRYGVYHITNAGTCTWYGFAGAIAEQIGSSCSIQPCTTDEFPRPAARPRNSVLEAAQLRAGGFDTLRHWRQALTDYLEVLQAETAA